MLENPIVPTAKTFVPAPRQPARTTALLAPSVQASMIERVMATPAPVPRRTIQPLRPVRLDGAYGKRSPQDHAIAALIRSLPVNAVMVFSGITAYLAIGYGIAIGFVTLLGVLVTFTVFHWLEYRYSPSGVADRSNARDALIEDRHDARRHQETMLAIQGDLLLKEKMLDAAIESARRYHDARTAY